MNENDDDMNNNITSGFESTASPKVHVVVLFSIRLHQVRKTNFTVHWLQVINLKNETQGVRSDNTSSVTACSSWQIVRGK